MKLAVIATLLVGCLLETFHLQGLTHWMASQ